jgi:hypothetical protein
MRVQMPCSKEVSVCDQQPLEVYLLTEIKSVGSFYSCGLTA